MRKSRTLTLQRRAGLTLRALHPPLVAQWVADCVLRGQFPVGRELKTAFQLLPLEVRAERCGLPAAAHALPASQRRSTCRAGC